MSYFSNITKLPTLITSYFPIIDRTLERFSSSIPIVCITELTKNVFTKVFGEDIVIKQWNLNGRKITVFARTGEFYRSSRFWYLDENDPKKTKIPFRINTPKAEDTMSIIRKSHIDTSQEGSITFLERIHDWTLNNKKIEIYRKRDSSDGLWCQIHDLATKEIRKGPLPVHERSIGEYIESLKNSDVCLTPDGAPVFAKPIASWKTYPILFWKYKVLKLFKIRGGVVWQVFDAQKKISQQFSPDCVALDEECLDPDLHGLQIRCAKEAISSFKTSSKEESEEVQKEKCLSLMKDFRLVGWDNSNILLEPVMTHSRFDRTFKITKHICTVMIVLEKSPCSECCKINHAKLVIEELEENNEYSVRFAHLTDTKGVVFLKGAEMELIEYIYRTKIWVATSVLVNKMWNSILEDAFSERKLSLFGRDSYFSGGLDNCFTWSREKFKILNIYLGKSWFGFVITIPRMFTDTEANQQQIRRAQIKRIEREKKEENLRALEELF